MSQLQSTLWKSFVRHCLPNTREEQAFSIVKNLQVSVISKAFYKYSFVSGRHLFPVNTTRCDATSSLRSGSGLLRKLIFCSYTHLVKAEHMYSPWDSDGHSLVAWVYPLALISPLCLFSESKLLRYSVLEFLPQCGILLFDISSLFHVYNNFVSVISISAFTFLDGLFYMLEYETSVPGFIRYSQKLHSSPSSCLQGPYSQLFHLSCLLCTSLWTSWACHYNCWYFNIFCYICSSNVSWCFADVVWHVYLFCFFVFYSLYWNSFKFWVV